MKNLDQKFILKSAFNKDSNTFFAIYLKQQGSFELFLNSSHPES
jgi:hypothetical protein